MKPEGFCWWGIMSGVYIPEFLLRYRGIGPAAKLCFARLIKYCGDGSQTCYPSQETLAEDLGVSVRTVGSYLAELASDGFITIIQQGMGKPNVYKTMKHDLVKRLCEGTTSDQDTKKPSGQETQTSSEPTYSTEVNQQQGSQSSDRPEDIPSSEDHPTIESTIQEVKNAPGHRNSGAVRRCVTEGFREEMADWTQERVTAHFVEQMGKSNGFRNSKRREPRTYSPVYRNGSKSAPDVALVVVDPAAERDMDAYMRIGIESGKPLGDAEREAAWPLLRVLDAAQRRAAAEDYLRTCLAQSDPKYIPTPASHLSKKPWTRIAVPRSLPVLGSDNKQAESDRKWQESADRLRIKHERIAAAKAARGAQP